VEAIVEEVEVEVEGEVEVGVEVVKWAFSFCDDACRSARAEEGLTKYQYIHINNVIYDI